MTIRRPSKVHRLSPAELARLSGNGGDQDDLFRSELQTSRLEVARTRNADTAQYEAMKRGVRSKAKNHIQYERGIKAGVKRIRY